MLAAIAIAGREKHAPGEGIGDLARRDGKRSYKESGLLTRRLRPTSETHS